MRRQARWVTVAVLAALLLPGCTETQTRPDSPYSGNVTLCLPANNGWVPLTAEMAISSEARGRGLSGRDSLPRRSGMLFLYPEVQGPSNQFWMYRTNIPLTIAFMKADGTIAALQGMSPCLYDDSDQCPRFRAGVTHRAALEVNQGLFEAMGVKVGDRVTVDPSDQGECRERTPMSVDALLEAH